MDYLKKNQTEHLEMKHNQYKTQQMDLKAS